MRIAGRRRPGGECSSAIKSTQVPLSAASTTKCVACPARPSTEGLKDSSANAAAAARPAASSSSFRPSRNTSTIAAAFTRARPMRMPEGLCPNTAMIAA